MPTRGVGFAHRNQPKMARFCPWCGVEALVRDRWRDEHQIQESHIEWVCGTCGMGFNLSMSARANYAVRLLREHAKLRNGCYASEDGRPVPGEGYRAVSPSDSTPPGAQTNAPDRA